MRHCGLLFLLLHSYLCVCTTFSVHAKQQQQQKCLHIVRTCSFRHVNRPRKLFLHIRQQWSRAGRKHRALLCTSVLSMQCVKSDVPTLKDRYLCLYRAWYWLVISVIQTKENPRLSWVTHGVTSVPFCLQNKDRKKVNQEKSKGGLSAVASKGGAKIKSPKSATPVWCVKKEVKTEVDNDMDKRVSFSLPQNGKGLTFNVSSL